MALNGLWSLRIIKNLKTQTGDQQFKVSFKWPSPKTFASWKNASALAGFELMILVQSRDQWCQLCILVKQKSLFFSESKHDELCMITTQCDYSEHTECYEGRCRCTGVYIYDGTSCITLLGKIYLLNICCCENVLHSFHFSLKWIVFPPTVNTGGIVVCTVLWLLCILNEILQ